MAACNVGPLFVAQCKPSRDYATCSKAIDAQSATAQDGTPQVAPLQDVPSASAQDAPPQDAASNEDEDRVIIKDVDSNTDDNAAFGF